VEVGQTQLLLSNDPQDTEIVFGNRNLRPATQGICSRDEPKHPLIAAIVHANLVVGMQCIDYGGAGSPEGIKKRVQQQAHVRSTSSRLPTM
jgi:hypothetical protein